MRPRIIGHRGAAAVAPENTLVSLRAGVERGADWIEIDVRLSSDGHPVLLHDDTLDRTTSGSGPVRRWSRADLETLDAGRWFSPEFEGEPLPDLAAALEALPPEVHLVVELKSKSARHRALPDVVAGTIEHAGRAATCTVSSSRWELLEGLRDRIPALRLALVFRSVELRDPVSAARRAGAYALHPSQARLSDRLRERASAAGLELCAYTINDEATLDRALAIGVDGVFTDDPATMGRWLTQRFDTASSRGLDPGNDA